MNFAALVAAASLAGTFALQTGTPKISSTLSVTPLGAHRARLAIVQRAAGVPIETYDLDMTKLMHLIVVSDDLRSFSHVHPAFLGKGRFAIDTAVPEAGYRVYADDVPHGLGQQVFRFDVGATATPAPLAPALEATAGPYRVRIATNRISTKGETRLALRVTRDGKPAADLLPYLGAAGHAVFLNVADGSYVHVHPVLPGAALDTTSMPGMAMPAPVAEAGPNPDLHVQLRTAGTYRLWYQFRSQSGLYVAAFSIIASD